MSRCISWLHDVSFDLSFVWSPFHSLSFLKRHNPPKPFNWDSRHLPVHHQCAVTVNHVRFLIQRQTQTIIMQPLWFHTVKVVRGLRMWHKPGGVIWCVMSPDFKDRRASMLILIPWKCYFCEGRAQARCFQLWLSVSCVMFICSGEVTVFPE